MSKGTDERLSLIAEIIYLREMNYLMSKIILNIEKEETNEQR